MARAVVSSPVDAVIVGVPQRVAKAPYVVGRHFKAQIWSILEILLVQVLHDLLSSSEFSVRGVEHDLRVEALFQFAGLSLAKCSAAVVHCRFHFIETRLGV